MIVETEADEGIGTVVPACPDVQAGRVGGVHGFVVVSPSGKVAGRPAAGQLVPLGGWRLDARMPDCPDAREANSKGTRQRRIKLNFFISLTTIPRLA